MRVFSSPIVRAAQKLALGLAIGSAVWLGCGWGEGVGGVGQRL
ncbi:hypothetical protein [Paenibacillus aceti]|nr:hypothetical protein [Paenibacillus aceti]